MAAYAVAALTPAEAGDHPDLVSVDATDCAGCHEDLLAGASLHEPAVEDCTSCHDVSIEKSGTLIDLAAADPELCILCHDDLEAAAGMTRSESTVEVPRTVQDLAGQ